jgi:hypothetical protein
MITVGSLVEINRGRGTGKVLALPTDTNEFHRVKLESGPGKGRIGSYYGGSLSLIANVSTPVSKRFVYDMARRIVLQLGREQRYVTSDHVQKALLALGYKATDLGNAAGTLFKDGSFVRTNQTVKSNRPSARGRRLPVWEYVGTR